jgi:hypothetical protein
VICRHSGAVLGNRPSTQDSRQAILNAHSGHHRQELQQGHNSHVCVSGTRAARPQSPLTPALTSLPCRLDADDFLEPSPVNPVRARHCCLTRLSLEAHNAARPAARSRFIHRHFAHPQSRNKRSTFDYKTPDKRQRGAVFAESPIMAASPARSAVALHYILSAYDAVE